MTSQERLSDFHDWLYSKVQSVHYMTDDQFENIVDKFNQPINQ
jgi:hypothetical protein